MLTIRSRLLIAIYLLSPLNLAFHHHPQRIQMLVQLCLVFKLVQYIEQVQ